MTERQSPDGRQLTLPCGQCIGCRLSRADEWRTRIVHEAQLHDNKCFVTLTFNDEHLPSDQGISVRDVQLFMKRLRKRVGQVRFVACGEYGEKGQRPHYHLLLFGYDFPDRKPWRKTGSGYVVDRSAIAEEVWPFGHVEIGSVTPESAGYVARYVLKKTFGTDEVAAAAYRRFNDQTGEVWTVAREFLVMSRRPGIGKGWYEQFSSDAFPSDFVIIEGQKRKVPRYYLKQLDGLSAEAVGYDRHLRAKNNLDNNTPERLAVREELQHIKAQQLVRELEKDK